MDNEIVLKVIIAIIGLLSVTNMVVNVSLFKKINKIDVSISGNSKREQTISGSDNTQVGGDYRKKQM